MKNFTSRVSPKNVVALCMLLLSVFGVLKNETAKGQQLVGSYIYYVTLGGSTWIGTTDSFAMCSSTTSYDMTDFVNIAFDHYPSDPGTLTTTSVQIVTITAPANGTITFNNSVLPSSTTSSDFYTLGQTGPTGTGTYYAVTRSGGPTSVVYTPNPGFIGTDPFVLQLQDGSGSPIGDPITYMVNVESPSPVFTVVGTTSLCPGQTATIANGNNWGGWTGGFDMACNDYVCNSPYLLGSISSSDNTIASVAGGNGHEWYNPFTVTGGSTPGSSTVTINWTNACGSGSQTFGFSTYESPSLVYPYDNCVGNIAPSSYSPTGGSFSIPYSSFTVDGVGNINATSPYEWLEVFYTDPDGCIAGAGLNVDGLNPAPTSSLEFCSGTSQTYYELGGVGITGYTWSSSDNTIASITDYGGGYGDLTGVAPGTANITFTATGTNAGCSLTPNYVTQTVVVDSIPGSITFSSSEVIAGSPTPVYATETTSGSWGTWSSNLSIDPSLGFINGYSPGYSVITFINSFGCQVTAGIAVNALGFENGNAQTINACENVALGIDSYLSVFDQSTTSSLTFNVTSAPTNGSVSGDGFSTASTGGDVSTTGFTYTPNTGFTGTDNFTITVTDESGNTDNTSFTVNVNYGGTVTLSPSVLCVGGSGVATVDVSGGTWSTGSGGTSIVTVDGSGNMTGVANGTDNIIYSVAGCSAAATVTVNSPASVSVASTTINITPSSSGPTAIPATTVATDATSGGTWSATGTTLPSTGLVALTINPATGSLSAIWPGSYTVFYTLPGGCDASANISVGSTVSGFIVDPPSQTWAVNTANVHVSDTLNVCENTTYNSFNNYLAVFDNSFTATLTWSNTSAATHGTVSGSYAVGSNGSTLEPSDFTYSPNPNYSGIDSFVSEISDGTNNIFIKFYVNVYPISPVHVSNFCISGSTTAIDSTSGGTWSELNGSASISSSGVVTASAAGSDSIIYTMPSGCRSSAFVRLDAAGNQPINSYISFPWGTGGSVNYNCSNGFAYLNENSGGGVWSCSDSARITFDWISTTYTGSNAYINCNTAGDEIIYYTVNNTCGTVVDTFDLTIYKGPDSISVPGSVCVGATVVATVDSTSGNWYTVYGYSSVDASGNVTGVSAGYDYLVYSLSDNGCYAYKQLEVDGVITSPGISGAPSICSGGESSIVNMSDSIAGGIWTSSNPSIISVATYGPGYYYSGTSGTWSYGENVTFNTGSAFGTALLTYTYSNGCGTYMDTTRFSVNQAPSAITVMNLCHPGDTTHATDSVSGGIWGGTIASWGYGTLVTIDSSGLVTAVNDGIDFINYTLPSGCSSTALVSVGDTISPINNAYNQNVCVGTSIYLTEDYFSGNGTWSSSNPSVASIGFVNEDVWGNNNIYLIGASSGTATITYSRTSNCRGTEYVTYPINVVNPTEGEVITGSSAVTIGSPVTLSDSVGGGTWSAADTTIARVGSGGVVTAISSGTTAISYNFSTTCGTHTATKIMTVNVTHVAAIAGLNTVCGGASISLTDSTAGGTWTSSNTSVATVTTSGVVSGIAGGTATISYSLGSISVTKNITVNPPVAISGTSSVCTGNIATLTDATTGGVWTSSNIGILTVTSAGVVTGVAAGSGNITYTKSGCYVTHPVVVNANTLGAIAGVVPVCVGNTITATDTSLGGIWSINTTTLATVNSSTGLISGIAVGSPTLTYSRSGCYKTIGVTVNNTYPASITGTAAVCSGDATTLSDATTGGTWSSSNTAVATVGSTGIVTGGTTTGTANITYTKTGCSVATPVTVNANPLASITGVVPVCVGGTFTAANAVTGGVWSVNSTSLATVSSSSGLVTGVAAGTPVLTYSLSGCYKTATITVNNTYPASLTGSGSVCTGNVTTLADATTGGTWSSSNTAVASVSSTGVVTGVASGTANISYSKLGCSVASSLTVSPNSVGSITGVVPVCVGNSITAADTTAGGVWSVNNTALATVNTTTGQVTGVAVGVPVLTYASSGCYKTANVTVANTYPASVSGSGTVCSGDATTLTDATTGGTWSSSNTSVATVSSTGVVTGGSTTGTANISYTFSGCSVSTPITINANPIGTITGVVAVCVGNTFTAANTATGGTWSVNNTSLASVNSSTGLVTGVAAGAPVLSYSLSGCYKTANVTVSNTYPASLAGSGSVCSGATTTLTDATTGGTWSSSNTAVANVSSAGVVTGGTTTGTAVISYNKAGCSVTQPVTVNANPIAAITGTNTICTGNNTTLADATAGGTWSSSNTSVATVSGGLVFGISAGTATITYLSSASGCFKTDNVTVNSTYPASITGSDSVCTGNATTLADATTGGTWSSSNTSIATVSSAGVVTSGTSTGATYISYTKTGCSVSVPITVSANSLGSITGVVPVCVGNTFTAANTVSGGLWSINNTTLATVNTTTGLVTGVAAGTPVLTYSALGCYKTITVTVNNTYPASIAGSGSVCTGDVTTLTDATTGGTWSSSNAAIAAVGSTGIVTGGTTTGTANISYTKSGCSVTTPVSVGSNPIGTITGVVPVCVGNTFTAANTLTGGSWSVNNTSLATVNATTGLVTGVAAGAPVLTYTSSVCYKTATITVSSTYPVAITGTASVCSGNVTTLSDLTTGGTWSSSNLAVASVSSTGVVTGGASTGTTTITYNKSGCYVTQAVAVNANPIATITGTTSFCTGANTTLTDVTSGGAWSSSNTAVATVGGGLVYGVSSGSVTITYKNSSSGCYKTASVVVKPLPAAITGGALICAGSTSSLASATTGGTWSSGSTAVATINSSGVITGVSTGYSTVLYTAAGCTTSQVVTVNINALPPISGYNEYFYYGHSFVYSYDTLSIAAIGGTWSSSNTSVANIISTDSLYHIVGFTVTPYESQAVAKLPKGHGTSEISYSLTNGCYSSFSVTTNDTATFTVIVDSFLASGCTDYSFVDYDLYSGDTIFIDTPIKCGFSLLGSSSGSKGTAGHRMGYNTPAGDQQIVSGNLDENYTVYPNPTAGLVNIIQSITDNGDAHVNVVNQLGQVCYSGQVEFIGGTTQLELSALTNGTYIIQITSKNAPPKICKLVVVR